MRRPLTLLALIAPAALLAATGGPDGSGMIFTDSDEADGPPHGVLDLSGGTALDLSDDDSQVVSLPFDFTWYGTDYDEVTISSNGAIFFDGAQSAPLTDCAGGSGTWSGVAAFGDDLDEGEVTWRTLGRYPHRVFAVEWRSPHADVGGEGLIQAWLLEGEGRREEVAVVLDDITFGDSSVDGGVSAVIGVQSGDGDGVSWSCLGSLTDASTAWFGPQGTRPASTSRYTSSLEAWWQGSVVSGYAGRSLAMGDINGDDLSDVLIGQQDEAAAWLFYGTEGLSDGEVQDADVALSYTGSDPVFAASLLLEDYDGDGLAEVIIGATGDDTGAGNAGAVYLLGGGGLSGSIEAPDDLDLLIAGPSSVGDARAGTAMAAADVNGDGYRDLVIGAPYADTAATQAGAVYVLYGALSALTGTDELDSADAVLHGASLTDWAGYRVAAADLDGDGAAELAVGAPNADDAANNAGIAYLMAGGALSGTYDLDTDSVVAFTGGAANDKAGSAVALGDLDGDGLGDLILGAPYSDDGASNGGAVYAFYGVLSLSGTVSASSADLSITATSANASTGSTLLVLDLNDDGMEELIVGSPNEVGYSSGGGSVRVFSGGPTGSLSTTDADSAILGTTSGGQYATAIAAGGDSDGDGFIDILGSAPYGDSLVSGGGDVYLWSTLPAFEDSDGDGFVTIASGGLDCDDSDPDAWPGNPEVADNLTDDDCDGFIDDAVSLRGNPDWMDYDVGVWLGGAASDRFSFESAASGDDLELHYEDDGVVLTPDGTVGAAAEVGGSVAVDGLAAKVGGLEGDNGLTLQFVDGVDAIALRVLDIDDGLTLTASLDGVTLIETVPLSVRGPDRAGGVYLGALFTQSVDTVRLTAEADDVWGIDELEVIWAARTDRDGDGYTDEGGDCDDSDPAINPDAEEDLTNGVDDDCDGAIDGGSLTTYDDYTAWSADAGLSEQVIDFEEPALGAVIDDEYEDLGMLATGSLTVSDDIDGSAPIDAQAGAVSGSVTLSFDELQPAVGLWILDAASTITVAGSADGTALYIDTITVSNNNTDGGSFLGLVFDYGVDELTVSGGSDDFGVDDIILSALGLDDADGDGYTEADGDCDDHDAEANPDAEEVWYDGVDSDCDGASDYDVDGDGHDSSSYGGYDCDDTDSGTSPDAEEVWYDGIDSDCDGWSDYDADGDGVDLDPDDPDSGDCDDSDADINPDAEEVWYDGVDSDCDGASDYDADGDGYDSGSGGAGSLVEDCDDSSADIGPDAEEVWYDGVDQDCDGVSDYDADGDGYDAEAWGGEDCNDLRADVYPGASGEIWYDGVDQDCDDVSDYDADGDGYDTDRYGGEDCDDTDPEVSPDAEDTPGDGVDTNCDGAPEYDDDGDGFDGVEDGGEDCDDADASINPDAEEVWYDGVDSDCDGESDYDADGDGFDHEDYGGADCDDTDRTVNPDAVDYYYDDIDQDCDGASDFDYDGDGYPSDWYGGDDCDDEDASINPGMTDTWYDGVDSDCDGESDFDADNDDVDSEEYGGEDCDDTDASINPYGFEVVGDGIDQDCDGEDDVDSDGDGYGSLDDCDDEDADIHPGAADACYDGIDANCDGASDNDCDLDGHIADSLGGDDCDDLDPSVSPSAPEVWYDGIDADCDGGDDFDADGDGFQAAAWGGGDCNDADATISPGVPLDDCGGGDEDCDAQVDEDCEQTSGDTADPGDDTGDPGGDTGAPGDDTGTSAVDTAIDGGDSGDVDPNSDWVPPEAGETTPARSRACGCSASAGGGGWLILGVLLVWRRRR